MVHEKSRTGNLSRNRKIEVDKNSKDYMKIVCQGWQSLYSGNTAGTDPEICRFRFKKPKLKPSWNPGVDKDEGKGSVGQLKEIAKDLVELLCSKTESGWVCLRGGYCMAEGI